MTEYWVRSSRGTSYFRTHSRSTLRLEYHHYLGPNGGQTNFIYTLAKKICIYINIFSSDGDVEALQYLVHLRHWKWKGANTMQKIFVRACAKYLDQIKPLHHLCWSYRVGILGNDDGYYFINSIKSYN